jgi:type IV pilus assembly protein PilQ
MQALNDIVDDLDVPRQQIVLEALVVELSEDARQELGIDWERAGPDTSASLTETAENFTGTLRWTSVEQRGLRELMMTIRTLVSEEKASVRSRPRVATVDGEKAEIDISREEYFNIVTDINGDFLQTELQKIEAGVNLRMTPRLGDEENISVDVSTEVSDVVSRRANMAGHAQGTNDLPVVRRRRAETCVRVKQGEAIVIGGLIESQEKDQVREVPVLGSIPYLGALFRTTKTVKEKKEVVIFITPRLVDDKQSAFSDSHEMIEVDDEVQELDSRK